MDFDGIQRIWTVDPATTETRLLFDDPYITGNSARYAPVGNSISMFASNPQGILVYDFNTAARELIQSRQGSAGHFSPDGLYLSYPIVVRGALGATFFSQLEAVDLIIDDHRAITGTPDMPIEDVGGYWRPGHADEMAVLRRYLDERFTEGFQVYLLNIATGDTRPLVVDANFAHGAPRWRADGQQLLLQRFDLSNPDGSPGVWLYDLQSDRLQAIAEDAVGADFLP